MNTIDEYDLDLDGWQAMQLADAKEKSVEALPAVRGCPPGGRRRAKFVETAPAREPLGASLGLNQTYLPKEEEK